MTFKKGQDVKQIVPVIAGKVLERKLIDDEIHYLIEWTDAEGEVQHRLFKETELEAA